jgi:hypothetical protein
MTYGNNENIMSLLVSISALLISIIALYYTIRVFIMKSGHNFRCNIGTCSTIECSDKYIKHITIENLKDRASVIFSIHVRYGLNNYLLIEDFSQSPLILKPFEVYHKEYEPILGYSLGTSITDLNKLIGNKKINKKIILSTTNGKYIVKYNIKRWDPLIPFFKNHYTSIIRPIRIKYKGRFYGDNVKYLVFLTHKNEQDEIIFIYKDKLKIKRFSKFQITKESLQSPHKLESFLKKQRRASKLSFEEIEIIDYSEKVDFEKSRYNNETREVEPYSFFDYKIRGKILSISSNYKMKIKNKRIQKKFKQVHLQSNDCI